MRTLRPLFCLVICALASDGAQAAVTNWTIQSAYSSLTVSARYVENGNFYTVFYDPQGVNSLRTTFHGSIITQQTETIPGIPADIQFLSASIAANNSGNWDPLPGGSTGTAPANYGLEFGDFLTSAHGAIRDIQFSLSSGILSLSGAPPAQSFSSSITAEFLSGAFDFRGVGIFVNLGEGSNDFAGQTSTFTSNATLAYGPTVTTLTIPSTIGFIVPFFSEETSSSPESGLYFELTGSIRATAPTESVPEANSLALLGLAGSVIGFLGYRRHRQSQVVKN